MRHVWPDGPEKPGYGRGLLAGGMRATGPRAQKIYVFDQQTAQPQEGRSTWPPLGIGGGNLLVAGGRLLVATRRRN